jgi:hypothetical protein
MDSHPHLGMCSYSRKEKTMSSTTLSRLSGISLLLGALVSIVAGLMTLFFDSSLSASPTTIQSPLWSTYWSLVFVALVLLLAGLPAFYLTACAAGRGGVLGLTGVFLVVLGNELGMATVAYFVSILPLLAAKAPNLINAGYETSLALFGISATALGIIGPLVLGIAVIRAKVFPPLVGILLMVSGVLSPVTTFASGVLFALIGLVGIISAAITYGWVGITLMQQPKVREAEAASPAQAALR